MLQEPFGLGERGGSQESLEDLPGAIQGRRGLGWSGELEEAPAEAEQGERLLGDDSERLPTNYGIAVGLGCGSQVATSLGQRGVAITMACSEYG